MTAPEAVDSVRSIDALLAGLADPTRRRIVELLGDRPRRVGELAGELAVSPSRMSRHLKVLRDCRLVEESSPDFDARIRIYSLRSGATAELRRWLDRMEQGWSEQLLALKAHVEGGR